jgi:hypothetical protein
LKRSRLLVPGLSLLAATAVFALAGPFGGPNAGAQAAGSGAPQFDAKFETTSDFYDRFDYGYSGFSPWEWNGGGNNGAITEFHGDHNEQCEAPTTQRTVTFGTADEPDLSQVFWHCAPGDDPAKGHLMTGVDTLGYNIAWFSPKPVFTGVSQVCWDMNETAMSHRKWTQVLFVGLDDVTRHPSLRGSGGYDLGYTSPDFRQTAPNTGIFPAGGTLAGLKNIAGTFGWFEDQDTWTDVDAGWPGVEGVSDKATRYQHCLANQPNDTIRMTQDTPSGTRVLDLPGQIPQQPVKVVFQDDNYDPVKDERYDPNALTWHWDNVQVFAEQVGEPPAPPSPELLAAQAPSTSGAAPDSGSDTDAPADSDEVSFGSAATKFGDAVESDRFGPFILVVIAIVVAASVLFAYVRTRRGAATGSGSPPADPSNN